MKTIVKAIESMLAQDATQQWTAATRAARSGLQLELGLTAPFHQLDRTPPHSFGPRARLERNTAMTKYHRRSARSGLELELGLNLPAPRRPAAPVPPHASGPVPASKGTPQ